MPCKDHRESSFFFNSSPTSLRGDLFSIGRGQTIEKELGVFRDEKLGLKERMADSPGQRPDVLFPQYRENLIVLPLMPGNGVDQQPPDSGQQRSFLKNSEFPAGERAHSFRHQERLLETV